MRGKKSTTTGRPVRRETIRALAQGNRYRAAFDAVNQKEILEKSGVEATPRNDVDELLEGMRKVLARSGRRKFTAEDKERILEVVRVLVS